MESDKVILGDLIAWGRALEGFTQEHAELALSLARDVILGVEDDDGRLVEGIGEKDRQTTLLLAMDMTWLLWLDDRFDAGAAGTPSGADPSAGLSADPSADPSAGLSADPSAGLSADPSASPSASPDVDWVAFARSPEEHQDVPEIRGFLELREQFAPAARDQAALLFWWSEAVDVFHAYHENQLFSRGKRGWTYADYLQNGAKGIGVMQCLSSISLLYGFDMPSRIEDLRLSRALKNLCLTMRLQNDLASAAKERAEGDKANAVLFLENVMPTASAISLVTRQKKDYERRLNQDLEELGPADPLARTSKVMLWAMDRLYKRSRERYR